MMQRTGFVFGFKFRLSRALSGSRSRSKSGSSSRRRSDEFFARRLAVNLVSLGSENAVEFHDADRAVLFCRQIDR